MGDPVSRMGDPVSCEIELSGKASRKDAIKLKIRLSVWIIEPKLQTFLPVPGCIPHYKNMASLVICPRVDILRKKI